LGYKFAWIYISIQGFIDIDAGYTIGKIEGGKVLKIVDMRDRFARGVIAGFAAALCQTALNIFSYFVLHVPGGRYYNFAASLVLGKKSSTVSEAIFSVIIQIGFATAMGVLFAYLILGIKSKNHILKGMLWGLTIWFASYAVITLFKIETGLKINIFSATSNAITSAVWGILLVMILRWLDNKFPDIDVNKIEVSQVKHRKFYLTPEPAKKPEEEKPKFKKSIKVGRRKHWCHPSAGGYPRGTRRNP